MIRLEDVTKTYWSGGVARTIAANVNLTIPPRRAVALIGRNGAGKSSLLRMIAGTMRPTAGRISVTGSVS
jgi:capsular polysaccharide transport system ATP-binding protein